jgi:molybdopterin-biosynthesis enzyme MoeA-like protein
MIPNAQQLISDVRLLVYKKYHTKKAMSQVMAGMLQRDVANFYGVFIRCTGIPEAVTKGFMDSFYNLFQTELDTFKRNEVTQGTANTEESIHTERATYIEDLTKENDGLRNTLYKVIENNTVLVLSNQKLVEAQLILVAKLPDP